MNARWTLPFTGLVIVAACGGRVATSEPDFDHDAGSAEQPSALPSTGGAGGGASGSGATTGQQSAGYGGGCPALPGPAMVQVPVLDSGSIVGGSFCIDSTEVTRSQYDAWLAEAPSTDGQPTVCAWNESFVPKCENGKTVPDATPDLPQVCVDWCDAYAYCKGVGKRLCGRSDGGATPYEAYADADVSAWSYACTSGGVNAYVYGDVFDPEACHVTGEIQAVASNAACQSSVPGFEGVYDLNGNVAEWEDACDGATGEWDTCRTRGGGTYGVIPDETTRCAAGGAGGFRGEGMRAVGFRCCWP